MNLDTDVYEDTFAQWALWWIMITFVGGLIIGLLLITILG